VNHELEVAIEGPHCKCLGWENAFKVHNASCELAGPEACKKFMMKLPNFDSDGETRCLGSYPGAFLNNFCFVSRKCKAGSDNLWSKKPSKGAKYKRCVFNTLQRRFGTMPFDDLKKFAKKNDLSVVTTAAWAYPSYTWGHFLMSYVIPFGHWTEDPTASDWW